MNDMLYPHEKEALKQARETYGNKNQILVCMEELNELACVLAKYPRYADESQATQELHDKALDEMADVLIILDHVQAIMGLTDTEIRKRISAKIDRLNRWLLHSESMQETIDDRTVEEHHNCQGCEREGVIMTPQEYENYCKPCHMAQATDGTAPFYAKGE